MKLVLASDLNLELADVELPNTNGTDVLILSGNIVVAHDSQTFIADEIYAADDELARIVYLAGKKT